ncbi:MAG: hypothetical protein ACI9WC_001045 [Arenicella sp.]|jgi:hypothetical protein
MDLLLILSATLKLGLPVLMLSWLLFSWLYREGKLERKADRKETAGSLKEMKIESKAKGQGGQNYLYDKWMWFGSGFYGLAALWTFMVIELLDFAKFVFNFPGFASLFAEGIINTLVTVLVNQLGNILSAFIWFNYWSDGSPITWFLIAYLSYLGGIELAKRHNLELPRKSSS